MKKDREQYTYDSTPMASYQTLRRMLGPEVAKADLAAIRALRPGSVHHVRVEGEMVRIGKVRIGKETIPAKIPWSKIPVWAKGRKVTAESELRRYMRFYRDHGHGGDQGDRLNFFLVNPVLFDDLGRARDGSGKRIEHGWPEVDEIDWTGIERSLPQDTKRGAALEVEDLGFGVQAGPSAKITYRIEHQYVIEGDGLTANLSFGEKGGGSIGIWIRSAKGRSAAGRIEAAGASFGALTDSRGSSEGRFTMFYTGGLGPEVATKVAKLMDPPVKAPAPRRAARPSGRSRS